MLFIAGLGFTVPALVGVVKDYYKYPVTTKVKVETADRATFPAVTICGLNRFTKCFISTIIYFEAKITFRIHCLELYTLIEEYSLNISMDSFTSEEEKDEYNETHSLLKRIYHETRCRQTYCEKMHEFFIPEVFCYSFFLFFLSHSLQSGLGIAL